MSQSRQRILFLCSEFPPSPGGIGNHGYNFINTLARKGYSVSILTDLENAPVQEAERFKKESGLQICYILRAGLVPIQLRRVWASLVMARQFRPHIIICSGRFSLWLGRMLGFFFRKPQYICIVHGNEAVISSFSDRLLSRPALRWFRTVVSVSQFTRQLIQPKYPYQTHVVIPNAIDTEQLSTYASQPMPAVLPGNPAILTVGNMTLRKGQQNVIKALPAIVEKYPDTHYHCVGLKTRAAENLKLALELGVEKHITFHGKLSTEQLMNAYRGCHLFAMLSETQATGDVEGFGIAILEANYFGKPAIGSAGCGIEDAIDQAKTGYKVAYNQPAEIADAVQKLLANYAFHSQQAHSWARLHNWDEVAERYIKLFARY